MINEIPETKPNKKLNKLFKNKLIQVSVIYTH